MKTVATVIVRDDKIIVRDHGEKANRFRIYREVAEGDEFITAKDSLGDALVYISECVI